jgi:hypothetical protein
VATRGYRTIAVALPRAKTSANVYASAKVADALEAIVADMTLYEGVRLASVLEAVYSQGKKDGAREAFDALDQGVAQVKKAIPHKRPGRPARRPN